MMGPISRIGRSPQLESPFTKKGTKRFSQLKGFREQFLPTRFFGLVVKMQNARRADVNFSLQTQSHIDVLILAASAESVDVVTTNSSKNFCADKIELVADTLSDVAHPTRHQNFSPEVIFLPDFKWQCNRARD